MRFLMRLTAGLLAVLALFVVAVLGWLHWSFGGGEPYPDLSGAPLLGPEALEVALEVDRPVGNAAVAANGDIFYTIHPEARPSAPFLYRARDGESRPWPETGQEDLFQSPLGVAVDDQNRVWTIDSGHHGTGQPRLLAFDAETAALVHRFDVPVALAPLGSFLQDFAIDTAGRHVYIADLGYFAQRPALLIYDTETGQARRVLERHPSMVAQPWLIQTPLRDMRFFGGLANMRPGLGGIALSRDDEWLYFAAMAHDTLYRIRAADLRDPTLDDAALAERIEALGPKPLNDGLSIDEAGDLYLTDVEHQGVAVRRADGRLETLVKDPRIRWADGLSFGPDGWLYLADSALPQVILFSHAHMAEQAPYVIWRFRPGGVGAPGR